MFYRVLIILMLLPSLALGQPVSTIPPGEDKIQPLKLKEPAPFDGLLYDYDTALRWGNWLQQYKLRLKIDVEAEQQKCVVKTDAADKTLKLYVSTHKALEEDLRKRVLKLEERNVKLDEELRNPPWYTTRTFGIVLGVVGTAATFGLSIWAIDSLRK